MEVIIIRIGFIGAGKAGFTLGKYFSTNGIEITGYYSKNGDSAKDAAIFTDSKKFDYLHQLVEESDSIFITTGDSDISKVWQDIKKLSIQGKCIAHVSGSLSSDVFSNISDFGAYSYSIHPLFVISDKYESYKTLKNAYFTLEGSPEHLGDFIAMLSSFGNQIQIIPKEKKGLYHGAAVFASNFVNALVYVSALQMEACGFSHEDALKALFPLIAYNIEGIGAKGCIENLTGPIERCDLVTLYRHFNSIEEKYLPLYKDLCDITLEIAKKKNPQRDYYALENFLEHTLTDTDKNSGGIKNETYSCNFKKSKRK